jgi:hypothetical protein
MWQIRIGLFGSNRLPSTDNRFIRLVRENCRWEHAGQAFFDGEVEPCINGRVVGLGAYYDVAVDGVVARLLGEQLPDGGWNCEAENGSLPTQWHYDVLRGLGYFCAAGDLAGPRLAEVILLN